MSRSIKPRFKCLILLRDNIWNTSKPLKFKKLKWKKIKRLLRNRNLKPTSKRKLKSLKWKRKFKWFWKKKFFSIKVYMHRFYRYRLNLRKTFFSMYGKYKIKKFSYLIKKFSHNGSLIKARNYLFNKTEIGNWQVDNLFYLMRKFESKLIVSLFRFGFFNTIHAAVHFIRLGGVLINNRIIKNPFYNLKESDIISLNKKFFYYLLTFNKKFKINKYKKRRFYYKKFPGVYRYRMKNLICWYRKYKYIYTHHPFPNELDSQKFISWDLVVYLIKLKRL